MADEGSTAARAEYPGYVVTPEDKTRWDNAGDLARAAHPADGDDVIWQAQRVIYNNRDEFPD